MVDAEQLPLQLSSQGDIGKSTTKWLYSTNMSPPYIINLWS